MNKQIKKMKAVMMEYVLIAVLIAAAVVGAVMFFGKSTAAGLDNAAQSIVDPSKASMQTSKNDYETSAAKTAAKTKVTNQHTGK